MAARGLSIEEAAQRLQVSVRTIRSYLRDGFLSSIKLRGDRKKYLDPVEVDELRREREEHGTRTLLSRSEIRQMQGRLTRLEAQMQLVLRVIDAQAAPLELDVERAKDLYAACLLASRSSTWDLEEIQSWVEIFLRLSEQDLEQMVLQDARPWKPFLKLCMDMSIALVRHPDYETSLDRQRLHRLSAEARRRLRVAAVCFTESTGGIDPALRKTALAEVPSSLVDSLERRVRRTLQKST